MAKMRQLIVVTSPTEQVHNFTAYAPEVAGCIATGDTYEQTLERMQHALQAHLRGMQEDGEELPLSFAVSSVPLMVDIEV